MAKEEVLTEDIIRELDLEARSLFVETCNAADVSSFGVCGIDMDDVGELLKVAAAAKLAATEARKSSV